MVIAVVALILGVLLGGFVLIPRHLKSAQKEKIHSNAGGKKGNSGGIISFKIFTLTGCSQKASKVYSKAEVSLHDKRTDCWIIIKGKVYDVTSYVEEHPGGDAILAHAGDDSTEGFYGPQHATRVFDMIDDFYIGELEQ